jgi:hypothetical protein
VNANLISFRSFLHRYPNSVIFVCIGCLFVFSIYELRKDNRDYTNFNSAIAKVSAPEKVEACKEIVNSSNVSTYKIDMQRCLKVLDKIIKNN